MFDDLSQILQKTIAEAKEISKNREYINNKIRELVKQKPNEGKLQVIPNKIPTKFRMDHYLSITNNLIKDFMKFLSLENSLHAFSNEIFFSNNTGIQSDIIKISNNMKSQDQSLPLLSQIISFMLKCFDKQESQYNVNEQKNKINSRIVQLSNDIQIEAKSQIDDLRLS